jgi:hypothetical protein
MHFGAQPAQTFARFAFGAEAAAFAVKKTIAYDHGALNRWISSFLAISSLFPRSSVEAR